MLYKLAREICRAAIKFGLIVGSAAAWTASAYRTVLATIRVKGWPRRIALACVSIAAALLSLLLARSGFSNELNIAFSIFLASIAAFSVAAYLSFDCAIGWRCVDFPWILASFAAVVVALTSIAESARRETLYLAKVQMSQSFANLIYAAQSTVTNDCDDLPSRAGMWTRSPEPYQGACDRMKHFIPQMQHQYNEFTTLTESAIPTGWGENIRINEAAAKGSWAGMYDSSTRFTRAITTFETAKARNRPSSGYLSRVLLGTTLRYWYYFMAFFVGLRLSKSTAEILLARHAARQARR